MASPGEITFHVEISFHGKVLFQGIMPFHGGVSLHCEMLFHDGTGNIIFRKQGNDQYTPFPLQHWHLPLPMQVEHL